MIESWNAHHRFLSPSLSSGTSSTHSSHLSILTSPSSVSSALSDVQVPSPLPSPSCSVTSSGSKTHAFFGSPFSDGSPSPLPPPNPPTRSGSLKSQMSTSSFTSADETPKVDSHIPPRSLNTDFFSTLAAQSRPAPPPSIRSLTASSSASPDSSPPASPPTTKKSLLPPLSRLFPSRVRYSSIDSLPSREPSFKARREFLHFDSNHPPNLYISGSSRTSSPDNDDRRPTETVSASPTPDIPSTVGPSGLPTPLSTSPPFQLRRPEPEKTVEPAVTLHEGDIVSDASLSLELVRTLGQGAFSSVWLARDKNNQLPALELSRKSSLIRSRSKKRGRPKRVEGTRAYPCFATGVQKRKPASENGCALTERADSGLSVHLSGNGQEIVEGGIGPGRPEKKHSRTEGGRLVAVKMTDRTLCDKNDRTRVSFVREVEVLRHVSHPSIVSYLHSFSTPSHHCLVLEHVSGGELFDLIDSPESHANLDEPLLRRIFGELCKAVGWMHGVGLVHRDIKLENILLTSNPFTSDVPLPPAPLIKLTDFGLSRFIDPSNPLLTTRCGSESYAAPELVTGRAYDGRETDAWSCGVVLYALATRRLPFDRPRQGRGHREEHIQGEDGKAGPRVNHEDRGERRALLVRIAKGEYTWPFEETVNGGELKGVELSRSEGVRRVVGKLLVRDPKKRCKIIDLWEDEWMKGEGAPLPPHPQEDEVVGLGISAADVELSDGSQEPEPNIQELDACVDALDEDDGVLVDGEDIGPGHVVRQEH